MIHRIAMIPGDGIGKEVVPAAARVLDAAGQRFGFELEWTTFDWSCERYTRTGRMMPEDGLDQLRGTRTRSTWGPSASRASPITSRCGGS